jgi:hypothetical protein
MEQSNLEKMKRAGGLLGYFATLPSTPKPVGEKIV